MEQILMDYMEFIPRIQNYIKKKKKDPKARVQYKRREEFLFLKMFEIFQISFTSS